MKKKSLNGLTLNKRVVANLNSTQKLKGGTRGWSYGCSGGIGASADNTCTCPIDPPKQ